MQNGSSVNERSVARSVALRGASLAFANGKPAVGPKPKPKPNLEAGLGQNDSFDVALAAAKKVRGLRDTSFSVASGDDLRLGYHNTGSSVGSDTARLSQQRSGNHGRNDMLQPPGRMVQRTTSASFIAATLAASRSPSVSPNPTSQQPEIKKLATVSPRMRNGSSNLDLVDATPVPPTNRLIGIFEGNTREGRTLPHQRANTAATMKRTPPRAASPILIQEKSQSPLTYRLPRPRNPENRPSEHQLGHSENAYSPKQSKHQSLPTIKQKPPVPSAKPIPIPIPIKPNSSHANARSSYEDGVLSDDSFVSASSQHTEPRTSPDYKPSFRAALATQRRLTSASTTSLTSTAATIDSMANAIVASSLASSRAASPSKSLSTYNKYPPVPPPRKTGRHHIFHSKDKSRTPSPAKSTGMKTTLRKVRSHDSIDEGEKRRGKKSLVKKHPHKHHEGDRKRWRDSITERERKRYEAVWASNHGLWLGDGDGDRVCSLVIRDVWSRSRLNTDVLEEVYALVDRTENGSLGKDEFVVGLWLVDQWLKGRKLPTRVGESVWRSVGGTGGIKVHGPKR